MLRWLDHVGVEGTGGIIDHFHVPPGSVAESNALWRGAQAAVRSETVNGRFVTSAKWNAADDPFSEPCQHPGFPQCG